MLDVRTFTKSEVDDIHASFSAAIKGWLSWVQSTAKPGTAEYVEAMNEIQKHEKVLRKLGAKK